MKGVMFRIFTEDTGRDKIALVMDTHFPSYTMYPAEGVWKGEHGKSLVLEVLSAPSDIKVIQTNVEMAAQEIKMLNHQKAVLVQKVANENWLI